MSVRILHVATRHRVGGAERNLLHTVSRELGRGFEVHVAAGTEDLEWDFPSRTVIHPLEELVREVSPTRDRRTLRKLEVLVRAYRFDVVQTHQSKAGIVGRQAARHLASTVVHTVHMASFGPAYDPLQSAIFLRLERRLARFTDRFVFVGTELQSRYQAARVAPPERSMVVRSPIANLGSLIGLRNSSDDQRERSRAAIGVPAECQVVLMVGALDRRKRHAIAINALAPLLLEGKIRVLIAGEGPERGAIEVLCRDLGVADSVKLLGFVADVIPLYAAADLFLQTSTVEGVPQAVVQAIAAGRPVVATDVDGVREVAPGLPHLAILPRDARGLLGAARAALAASQCAPAPVELVTRWLPDAVDADLSRLHDWMEDRAGRRRVRADGRAPVPALSPARRPRGELAIR